MSSTRSTNDALALEDERNLQRLSRRKFLGFVGASSVVLATVASSCSKDDTPGSSSLRDRVTGGMNLGSGDIGILNYAYALEQIEAAFYTKVAQSPYAGITASENAYLTDIRDHEVAHREFFKAALGTNAIGTLELKFDAVDFSSRTSVLATAKTFEDLGVSAYNGAGELLQSATYLLFAGKIVSVEARHAAAIRDMLSYGSFADSTAVDSMGLDLYRTPPEVLAIADTYISSKIISKNLPTS